MDKVMDKNSQTLHTDPFVSYYQNALCHLQSKNNELLREILQKNHSSAFYKDHAILCLPTHGSPPDENVYASIDEFREKVPLTTYENYTSYIDRMVNEAEKNVLSSEQPIYYNLSSGTTGKVKVLPAAKVAVRTYNESIAMGFFVVRRSLTLPPSKRPGFVLRSGRKLNMIPTSKDGIPMGPISNCWSVIGSSSELFSSITIQFTLSLSIIEEILNFEASPFVQLVFALVHDDIYSYQVTFATGFIHTVNMIESYFEEMCLCISNSDFSHSSLVQKHISDSSIISLLNEKLNEVIVEHGGPTYAVARAAHIQNECSKKHLPGILHRLWPNLAFASTVFGGSFMIYKPEIQFYCGEQLPLINSFIYVASEGTLGVLASIHTDEYFLLPTSVFFEFIKEEDIEQVQPKTLLVSELKPGHRYELVCTTEAGLVRYRMGDVVTCTRLLCRADDLIPLPAEPTEIPPIPLISLAYRAGSLLDAYGERTNEIHLVQALQQTVHQWKNLGISVDFCDFTSYVKLDAFPTRYVVFLELSEDPACKINDEQLNVIKSTASEEVERYLSKANAAYEKIRRFNICDPLDCILVRRGTFSEFLRTYLSANRPSPLQIKPHRLLRNQEHIQFFVDNQVGTSLS